MSKKTRAPRSAPLPALALTESAQARLDALTPLWLASDSVGARAALPACMAFFSHSGAPAFMDDEPSEEDATLALALSQLAHPKWLGKSLFNKGGLRQRLAPREALFLSQACALLFGGLFKLDSALFARSARLCGGLAVARAACDLALPPSLFGFYQLLARLSAQKSAPLALASLDELIGLTRESGALKEAGEAVMMFQRYASEAIAPIEWRRALTEEREETLASLLEKAAREGSRELNPKEWASFCVQRWGRAVAPELWRGNGAERAATALLDCISAAGGPEWLLERFVSYSGNLAQQLTSDPALARVAARCFAGAHSPEAFWGMGGPYHAIIGLDGVDKETFHRASEAALGLPSGALVFNPLVALLANGAWDSGSRLALSADELSSKRAVEALRAAAQWALGEGRRCQIQETPLPEAVIAEGALWPQAMRKLASIASKGESPEPFLAELARAHPFIQARLEALALMESSESGASRAVKRRAL